MEKFLLCIATLTALTLGGCAAPAPPAATKHGMIDAASFDPIFMSMAPGSPKKVFYKAIAASYKNDIPNFTILTDTIVVADSGVYLTEWDVNRSSFLNKLFIRYTEIRAVSVETKDRLLAPDSEGLSIETADGVFKFQIINGSARHAAMLVKSNMSMK